MEFTIRPALLADSPIIQQLITESARKLCAQDYSREQIEAALSGAFGLDSALIDDGTYFVAEHQGQLVGCGGWSKRKTLFGSNTHAHRDPGELDPRTDSARIRAFFVHPKWARRGIGRALLDRCEEEAAAHGFQTLELMATLSGVRLYSSCGFVATGHLDYPVSPGVIIGFVPMKKNLQRR